MSTCFLADFAIFLHLVFSGFDLVKTPLVDIASGLIFSKKKYYYIVWFS